VAGLVGVMGSMVMVTWPWIGRRGGGPTRMRKIGVDHNTYVMQKTTWAQFQSKVHLFVWAHEELPCIFTHWPIKHTMDCHTGLSHGPL